MNSGIISAGIALLLFAGFVAVYAGSVAWAVRDAQQRGHSGGRIVLFFCLFGPLSAIAWLAIRPKTRLVERQPTTYRNADDAIDAATRLDDLGDWDEAIAVLEYAAQQWPEHADYTRQSIKAIDAKRILT